MRNSRFFSLVVALAELGLTPGSPDPDNRSSVSRSFGRAIVSLILAPYIALSALAPEHVHEADADHPHSAAHRHVQPHDVGSHDHDHAQLAEDEGHVIWLDDVILNPPAHQFRAPAASPAEQFELVPPVSDWVAGPDYNAAPPHGPPRACLSLRAPPCLSA